MRSNPFTFGRAVTGKDFVNRRKELKLVMEAMLSGQSLLLYSSRRLGKTSLLLEAKRRLQRKLDIAYVDLYPITSRQRLAEEIVGAAARSSLKGNLSKIAKGLTDLLSSLRPRAVLTHTGEIGIELVLSERDWKGSMADAFDFGEGLAKKRKRRMVIIFDEFQEIRNLDGLDMEKLMRTRFQLHEHASYVFCGSKRHVLSEMFSDESRALYKFAKPIMLGPMTPDVLKRFVRRRFAQAGGDISDEVTTRIIKTSRGSPYNVQRVCYEVWSLSRRAEDPALVDRAMDDIVEHSSPEFEQIWEQVKGYDQRRLLQVLAQEEKVSYGMDFVSEYALKTPSHVRRSLTLLRKKGLVSEEGRIADLFFSEWVKRQ
ncbi:MAG: hypothetical protein KAW39_00070 [Thermoplasmata archaeon]|nr:hypothetical protein [Thermoplasmata archaeon]